MIDELLKTADAINERDKAAAHARLIQLMLLTDPPGGVADELATIMHRLGMTAADVREIAAHIPELRKIVADIAGLPALKQRRMEAMQKQAEAQRVMVQEVKAAEEKYRKIKFESGELGWQVGQVGTGKERLDWFRKAYPELTAAVEAEQPAPPLQSSPPPPAAPQPDPIAAVGVPVASTNPEPEPEPSVDPCGETQGINCLPADLPITVTASRAIPGITLPADPPARASRRPSGPAVVDEGTRLRQHEDERARRRGVNRKNTPPGSMLASFEDRREALKEQREQNRDASVERHTREQQKPGEQQKPQ